MKKFRIPIFTEEYAVNVLIGTRAEVERELAKYTTYSPKTIRNDFSNMRGITYNCYPEKHPIIGIDGDLPFHQSVPCLAHEASHALDYLQNHIGVDDKNGEFRAHGISSIMRGVLGVMVKEKRARNKKNSQRPPQKNLRNKN